MVAPAGDPAWVLVVDPIDGTRPAMAGLEPACVSVAAAPLEGEPRMGDVVAACIVEIKSGRGVHGAARGGPRPARRACRRTPTWAACSGPTACAAGPARPMAEVLAELIDGSSVGGATFDLGSACFDMTRICTGQLDAYVEPGPRMVADVPGMRAEFERVGGGAVLNNSPYDLAAAVLCLEEAGAVVTDAYGESLSDRPLLGSDAEFQMSCVAASNGALHSAIVEALDSGVERLARKLG